MKEQFLINEYGKIFLGLTDLSRTVRGYSMALPMKLQAMEKIYLQENKIYTDFEKKRINYFREAFTYKFFLASLHLEELWSLSHLGDSPPGLKDILINIYDTHEFSNDNSLLPSFVIEGFIIQGTAFLDFYMLYMCTIFKINDTNRLSGKKFISALEKIEDEPYKTRAEEVRAYFKSKVFGSTKDGLPIADNWGGLLKSLRNSLVHRDELHPDFQNDVSLLEKIIGSWPEKDVDMTFSYFCQNVQNVMFHLLKELAEAVYGVEYKSGLYKPSMW